MVSKRMAKMFGAALVSVLLVGTALAASPGYPSVARPMDFRGARFGATSAEIPGLHPVSERMPGGGARFKDVYYRENEPTTMAQASIVSVAYYFRDDRLRSVVVTMRGDANAFLVKDDLISRFGPGRQLGPLYGWTWDDFSVSLGPVDGSEMYALTYTLERAPGK